MTLLELLQLMRKHLKLVIILPVVCALVVGAYSFLLMPNTYTATTDMYVLTTSTSSSSEGLSSTDLSASQMLTNDVAEIVKSDRVKNDTAEALNMKSLKDYKIEVSSETTTRVISLSVSGEDAASCAIIANELVKSASVAAQEVMNVESINTIDSAETPEQPSGPNRVLYTAVAFLAGLFVAVAVVVLLDMMNTRVRNAEEIEELLGLPVVGRIPAMKGGK